jgi:hypothetical protein
MSSQAGRELGWSLLYEIHIQFCDNY